MDTEDGEIETEEEVRESDARCSRSLPFVPVLFVTSFELCFTLCRVRLPAGAGIPAFWFACFDTPTRIFMNCAGSVVGVVPILIFTPAPLLKLRLAARGVARARRREEGAAAVVEGVEAGGWGWGGWGSKNKSVGAETVREVEAAARGEGEWVLQPLATKANWR